METELEREAQLEFLRKFLCASDGRILRFDVLATDGHTNVVP